MPIVNRRRPSAHLLAVATAMALSAMAAPAFAGKVNIAGLTAPEGYDGFIVKYREGSAERRDALNVKGSLNRVAKAGIAGKARALGHVRRLAVGSDLVSAGKLDRVEAETIMRELAADPNVEYVEVNRRMMPTLTPNDTRYNEQWHYFGANGLRANTAWDRSTGAGTVVAVLDTGITPHTELNANVLPGYDFISNAASARDNDGRDNNPNDQGDWYLAGECGQVRASNSSWHGSHVAGTVAAVTNNAAGVAGVAYGSRIVPVRVLGKCGGTTADIADAIVWASGGAVAGVPANANPAEVINMSLGGDGACSATYQNAINAAVNRGTTVVIAAGNDNDDVANHTPGNCNNVISVAASDDNGDRAFYSNYGARIDVAAPGGETCSPNLRFLALGEEPYCDVNHAARGILSTVNTGAQAQVAQGYKFSQGTSMATPHVAGVVALMQSAVAAPLTPAQVEQALKDSARAFAAGACPGGCGSGMVDANAAVAEAIRVAGGGGGVDNAVKAYSNTTDVAINDLYYSYSSIAVAGRTGNAPSNASVSVDIVHSYRGDLSVALIAPDGSVYTLKNYNGQDGAANVKTSYTVDLSGEALNGTWKLRVGDHYEGDTGYINSWSVTF
ncbi:S8 family peptidase [Lysobacter antibioticus]|jgi:serine protease|uniref:S8 family peptidase n=1 Tax=Lysobacter antibioticus TaxID=84531 RepID=UPI0007164E2A